MVPFYASYFSLCANRAKIQSLPKDVRDQIMSVSGLAGSKQGVEERVKAAGITLNRYDVPPAELSRWQKVAGDPLWEEWVKKMEGKGHKEAREILNTALELAKK